MIFYCYAHRCEPQRLLRFYRQKCYTSPEKAMVINLNYYLSDSENVSSADTTKQKYATKSTTGLGILVSIRLFCSYNND